MTATIPDTDKIDVLAAERELNLIATIITHTEDLSDLAQKNALGRIEFVRGVLQRFRERYGMTHRIDRR